MPALVDVARAQLELVARQSLARSLKETERLGGGRIRRAGKEYISFSCNDYLGLAHHPRVIAAARDALERHGAGAGASRLVTGSHPPYAALEQQLAELKGTERALVFGSGYLANLGVIPALVGKNDLILADRLSHACTWDGTRLSTATVMRFTHNSVDHCEELLRQHRTRFDRCVILTETIFSMEGDRGPVAELGALARAHDAWLMTDDAHGLGICAAHDADLQMGTLSKAAGSYGGYVCARSEVIALLENKARTLLFATALPPSSVAAAAAALAIMKEDEALVKRPLENACRFTAALGRKPAQSPIVPVIVGEADRALAAAAMMESNGFLVVPIRPPTVPAGTARLRFAFSAMHRADDIERAAERPAIQWVRLMAGLYVTAVGTGIGKTLVTTILCHKLTLKGRTVRAIKPVVSGYRADDAASDPALILRSLGQAPLPQSIAAIAPWRFAALLSPHLAARKEGRAITLDEVAAFCRQQELETDDLLLIEGAGGVMAPIDEAHTSLDLMARLGHPVILVTGSYLGAISHTLTALAALRGRGIVTIATVVSESEQSAGLVDTVESLPQFDGGAVPIYALPRLTGSDEQKWREAPSLLAFCNL